MTVKLVDRPTHYVGESSDTKPTSATVGSTFQELDTGQKFIWDGSYWVEDLSIIHALDEYFGL